MSDVSAFIRDLTNIQRAGPVATLIKGLADGVHESTGALNMLGKFGKVPWTEGGEYVRWNINDNKRRGHPVWGRGKVPTGGQEFGKALSEVMAAIHLDIAYDVFQLEQNKNNPEKNYDYVMEQIKNTKDDMVETLEISMVGDKTTRGDGTTWANVVAAAGCGDTTHILVGLNHWIEATCDPSAFTSSTVIGGQTRSSTTTYLNNQAFSVANENALTSSDIMKMIQRCSHIGMSPNLGMMQDSTFRHLWNITKGESSFVRNAVSSAELGFPENITMGKFIMAPFKSMTPVSEGGLVIGSTGKKRIYFLNIGDGIQFMVNPAWDMKVGPPMQAPDEPYTIVQHVTWMGQFILKNPRLNGCIYWA